MITVLFFGPLAEHTGCGSLQLAAHPDTASLQQSLVEKFPALAVRQFALAVNKTIIHQNTALQEGSVVALLPPFSGG